MSIKRILSQNCTLYWHISVFRPGFLMGNAPGLLLSIQSPRGRFGSHKGEVPDSDGFSTTYEEENKKASSRGLPIRAILGPGRSDRAEKSLRCFQTGGSCLIMADETANPFLMIRKGVCHAGETLPRLLFPSYFLSVGLRGDRSGKGFDRGAPPGDFARWTANRFFLYG
jgi:hypothetical protein